MIIVENGRDPRIDYMHDVARPFHATHRSPRNLYGTESAALILATTLDCTCSKFATRFVAIAKGISIQGSYGQFKSEEIICELDKAKEKGVPIDMIYLTAQGDFEPILRYLENDPFAPGVMIYTSEPLREPILFPDQRQIITLDLEEVLDATKFDKKAEVAFGPVGLERLRLHSLSSLDGICFPSCTIRV